MGYTIRPIDSRKIFFRISFHFGKIPEFTFIYARNINDYAIKLNMTIITQSIFLSQF